MVKPRHPAKSEAVDTKKEAEKYEEQVDQAKEEVKAPNPYQSLITVLNQAYLRAAQGKGKDRHANHKPFLEQPIITEGEHFYIIGNLQQIRKKCLEVLRLDQPAARNELLDVIVYAAASVLIIDKRS